MNALPTCSLTEDTPLHINIHANPTKLNAVTCYSATHLIAVHHLTAYPIPFKQNVETKMQVFFALNAHSVASQLTE